MTPAKPIALWTGAYFIDPLTTSNKEQREAANKACIGGLRDPLRSLQRLPEWYDVGSKVAQAMDQVVSSHEHEVTEMLALIGCPEAVEPPAALISAARGAIAAAVNIEVYSGTGIWAKALATFVGEAKDPDVVVPEWLGGATPLGIKEQIVACGIFPPLSRQEAEAAARNYAPAEVLPQTFGNYSSYDEFREQADQELRREADAGFVEFFDTRAAMEAAVGP